MPKNGVTAAADQDWQAAFAEGWKERWSLVRLPEECGYRVALPAVHARQSAVVFWLLLGTDGLIYSAVAPDAETGVPGALAAVAAGPEPVREVEPGQPGVRTFGLVKPNSHLMAPDAVRALEPTSSSFNSNTMRLEAKLSAEEMEAFRAELDPAILAVMAEPGRQSLRSAAAYNSLAGAGAPKGEEARAGAWRRKAMAEFPLFAKTIRTRAEVQAAIDHGAPLVAALARAHGVREATVRALAGWPMGEFNRVAAFEPFLQITDCAPPDWLPRTEEGWKAYRWFNTLCRGLRLAPPPPGGAPDARAGARGVVTAFMRRNGPNWSAAEHATARQQASHLHDVGRGLIMEVVLPALGADGPLPDAWDPAGWAEMGVQWICATRSPAAALRLSAEHLEHANGAAAVVAANAALAANRRDARGGARPMAVWAPLGADAEDPNGVSITNLTSQAALDEEGQVMRHCVAGYGWMCEQGTSRILSLSKFDEEGTRLPLSTAEVRINADGSLVAVQHRAQRNGAPGTEARQALAWYLKALHSGEVASNARGLAMAVQTGLSGAAARFDGFLDQEAIVQALTLACGYDWRAAEARAAAWDRWARWLGGPVRKMTAAAFLRSCPQPVLDAAPDCRVRQAIRALAAPDHGLRVAA